MTNRRRPQLGILPVLLAVIQIVGTRFAAHRWGQTGSLPAVLLLFAGPALLLLRRKVPGPMVVGIALVSASYLVLGYLWGPFPLALVVGRIFAVIAGARWWVWGECRRGLELFFSGKRWRKVRARDHFLSWCGYLLSYRSVN